MKLNLPVTDKELPLDAEATIVSITDLEGRIVFGNDEFVAISGYPREQLYGSDHNILRHPDMPAEAFAALWSSLKRVRPWMGIVKNRTADGSYYVVDAFVAPILDGQSVVGYRSMRRRPDARVRERALRLYARIKQGKSLRRLTRRLGMGPRFALAQFGSILALGATAVAGDLLSWQVAAAGVGAGAALAAASAWLVTRPLRRAAAEARAVVDDPLAQLVYTGRRDELGALLLAIRHQVTDIATTKTCMRELREGIEDAEQRAEAAMSQAVGAVELQQGGIGQIATAMNEMAATAQDVARNAAQAEAAATTAAGTATSGAEVVVAAGERMQSLVREMERSVAVVGTLESDSEQIGAIVNLIRDITDQTNLLALNAAIEAARAGEHGRGFAVVADEVRSLAARTRQSTGDIKEMVERLQGGARDATKAMDTGREQAREAANQVEEAVAAFATITTAIHEITATNAQIASAAEEQSAVAEEINKNINTVHEMAAESLANTKAAGEGVVALAGLIANL